jgi:sugar porter (SP) family MFS transporter
VFFFKGGNRPSLVIYINMEQSLVFLGAINTFGGLNFGYNTAIIAYALISLIPQYDLDSFNEGLLAGSVLLGGLIGALTAGISADFLGRKKAILIIAVINIIAAIVLAVSPSFVFMLIVRAIFGFGVASSVVLCPLYVAETVDPQKRGLMGGIFQLAVTLGILIAYLVGFALIRRVPSDINWRVMLGLGGFPGVGLLILGIKMQESQLWIDKKRGLKSDLDPLLEDTESLEPKEKSRICSPHGIKLIIIIVALAATVQLTGINGIMFFAPSLLQKVGIQQESDILTILIGVWNLIITVGVVFSSFVDKFGRKPIWLITSIIMAISTLAMAIVSLQTIEVDPQARSWISVIAIALFIAGFAAGPGLIFWIIVNEIFPKQYREYGAAIGNGACWVFNLILTSFFQLSIDKYGVSAVFFGFSIIGIAMIIIAAIMLPETRPKPRSVN